jgi:hypothetical protein
MKEFLLDVWGDKFYPPGQLNRFWSMVKDITADELKHAIDHVAFSSNRQPSLGQIKSAALASINRAKEESRRKNLEELSSTPCELCGNSGWVEHYHPDNPHAHYSAICPCPASAVRGFTTNRGATYWRKDLEDKGWVAIKASGKQ